MVIKTNSILLTSPFYLKIFLISQDFSISKISLFQNIIEKKIISQILDGTIKLEQIKKAAQYNEMVVPRLEALVRMKDTLDIEFMLFSYMPHMYPFYTQIKADYLITSRSDIKSFVFIIQSNADGSAKCDFSCCSTFKQGARDYESNQRPRSLLKKERIHISSRSSTILLDKLTPQIEFKVDKIS